MVNRKDRQDKILLTAANLFLQKGYERTTIEDITDAVGINKALLYYYFRDKQSVLFEIMHSNIGTMLSQSRAVERLKISPRKKLELLIQKHLMRFADQKAVPTVSHAEMRNLSPRLRKRYVARRNSYEEIFSKVIREGIESGEFRKIDIDLSAATILGLLNSVTLWYRSDGHYSMNDISSKIAGNIFSGIETRKSIS